MRPRIDILRRLSLTTAVLTLFLLSACDVDIFGADRQKIGGKYSLLTVEGSCSLQYDGQLIVEGTVQAIGWDDHYLIVQWNDAERRDVIDLTVDHLSKLSAWQIATTPDLNKIVVSPTGRPVKRPLR